MNASKIQSEISKFCKKRRIPYNNLIKMSNSGWPDCMIVYQGTTYYLEIKYGRDQLSEIQKYRIKELNSQGKEIAFVVKSFPEFKEIFLQICKKSC